MRLDNRQPSRPVRLLGICPKEVAVRSIVHLLFSSRLAIAIDGRLLPLGDTVRGASHGDREMTEELSAVKSWLVGAASRS